MKQQSQDVLMSLIDADSGQPRKAFDPESLAGLMQSIKEVGVLSPILVRRNGDRFVVIDGERRWRACRQLGRENIPAIVQEGEVSEAETTQRQLIANCQREDLTAVEKARAIDRLMGESGWSAAETADKLGISGASVTRFRSLLSLPAEVLGQVERGEIAASAAYELSRVDDANACTALAQQAASGSLTRDALARKLRAAKCAPAESASGPSRATAMLGTDRSVTVAGPGLTLERLIEWLEELLAKARKARPSGITLGTFIKALRDQAKVSR